MLQNQFNQQLGIGAGNQRGGRDLEIQPEEFALAEQISDRLAAQTTLEQRGITRLFIGIQIALRVCEQVGAIHLQHGLQQTLHLDARGAGI